MLYVDIPNDTDLLDLASHRGEMSVSIYLPTTPVNPDAEGDRIAFKNLCAAAIDKLEAVAADKRALRELDEELDDLLDDDEFWRFQANGLAVFATPENLRTFRVPTALEASVNVSDRFHIKPLLRAKNFCNSGYVLALAEGSVRLVEVSADLPATVVKVEGLPKDAASAVGKSSLASRSHSRRIVGSEGKKVRLRQFARKVDGALRDLLAGSDLPLIIASVENLSAIYRSVNRHPHLASERIESSPERMTEAELAAAARPILDGIYKRRLDDWHDLYRQRVNDDRTTTDIATAARAATFGLVQSMVVDMNAVVNGTIDETTGMVRFEGTASAQSYGVIDEIVRRAVLTGAQVYSVREGEIPDGKPLAAILRYAL
jgi:hypothetical protein